MKLHHVKTVSATVMLNLPPVLSVNGCFPRELSVEVPEAARQEKELGLRRRSSGDDGNPRSQLVAVIPDQPIGIREQTGVGRNHCMECEEYIYVCDAIVCVICAM